MKYEETSVLPKDKHGWCSHHYYNKLFAFVQQFINQIQIDDNLKIKDELF